MRLVKLVPLKKLKQSCDKLFADVIKIRDGYRCVRCGKGQNEKTIHCAHIFSRSQHSVRWETCNAISLCSGCHMFWAHKNPVEFTEFVKQRLGEECYNKLREKAKTLIDLDRTMYENKIKELQDFACKIK